MHKSPGPRPFWVRWNHDNWRLLPATTLAKHLHISERLAERAKKEIARDPNWPGTPEDQAEIDRGKKLMTDADLDALAAARVELRE